MVILKYQVEIISIPNLNVFLLKTCQLTEDTVASYSSEKMYCIHIILNNFYMIIS